MRNYLIAMAVRILGFPVAVWLLLNGYVALGAALAVVATVVPSIAVVVANAVDHRTTTGSGPAPASPVRGLAAAPSPTDGDQGVPGSPAPDDGPILGTVVSSRDLPPTPREPGPAGEHDGARRDGDREAS